jgi:hypothetical protein
MYGIDLPKTLNDCNPIVAESSVFSGDPPPAIFFFVLKYIGETHAKERQI